MKPFAMVDMAKTRDEMSKDYPMPGSSDMPRYPYGLCISLDNGSLEKLGLEANCEVGDMLHLFAMAKVTSVSQRDTENGPDSRIELQITHMGIEDEATENMEEKQGNRARKRYGKEEEAENDNEAEDA